MKLAGHTLSSDTRPFIVAEMSGNHGGSLDRARAIIDMAAEAGADAIKFQTYEPDTITLDADGPDFRVGNALWEGARLYDLYEKAHTPFAWHPDLFAHARARGIMPFSAPFDVSAVELLESLDCPAYKIASPELVDIPLIRKVAGLGKPMILSTGMATPDEIDEAVNALKGAGDPPFMLLHCVSSYPADVADARLGAIAALRARYGCLVGLSDHSRGGAVPAAAVALGAALIEKHVCLGRDGSGSDDAFSLTPEELRCLVADSRALHRACRDAAIGPTAAEADTRRFRRSLYVTADVQAGDRVGPDNVRSVRPAAGLHPRYLDRVTGCTFRRAVPRGTPLKAEHLNDWEAWEADYDAAPMQPK
ncbi:pseudaminic acid synthase [Yunchengibacter salinarum]|uniref:pseudaminic acid synthase n=1 Tax=Yunchengibacter salinarum TaxID=3133399 RepID=UPI0035B6881A